MSCPQRPLRNKIMESVAPQYAVDSKYTVTDSIQAYQSTSPSRIAITGYENTTHLAMNRSPSAGSPVSSQKRMKPDAYCIYDDYVDDRHFGLTMIGKDKLKGGVEEVTRSLKLSDCERWKMAWSVIFPEVNPPASPYAQDPRTSLVEHVIQQIRDRPRSFDAGLVHDKIVQSEAVSRAIIARLIEFLRGAASLTSPIHSVLPYTGDKEGDTTNPFGFGETDVMQHTNSEAISNNFPAQQNLGLPTPTPTPAAQWHELMTTTDLSTPTWDYCHSKFLDEVMKDWQEGGAGDNS
ncbi:hypothetical protein CKAH01_18460 [Colletotrichum kahawae]|uniref:Uncharacterized protein n=1 Tax=Colletotrichum kahawae TaxID=34407 RepID=A0AAD9Y9P8_COLKA|nr:hypothetical protein CKAH01_18460 [Colletotrichum kahawae]